MKIWLIVNTFLQGKKYTDLTNLMLSSAKKYGVDLTIKYSTDLISTIGGAFTSPLPDCAIYWDKDIVTALRLEAMGVRLFNSRQAVQICDNKALTALRLAGSGIPIPHTISVPKTFEPIGYNDLSFVEEAVNILGLPVIIKETYGSFGQQVHLAATIEEAKKIIATLHHRECIMQEFVSSSKGRDIRINIVGNKAVASILRYNDNDFRSNLTLGGKMQRITPDNSFVHLAIDSCQAIGLDFAGVDVLFGKDGKPIICEVNSNPHFRTTLDCTGVNLADEIMSYIIKEMR